VGDLANPKGSRKNNFTFSHPIFRSSLAAPQSQNPRNSATIPVVLLNRRNQIQPKSGRQFCESIFARTLRDKNGVKIDEEAPQFFGNHRPDSFRYSKLIPRALMMWGRARISSMIAPVAGVSILIMQMERPSRRPKWKRAILMLCPARVVPTLPITPG
jgi:hypothetical protein